ncbi:hypothetical protein K457DRAFT_14624 [Linnemannia elongata AG-77]|uniref:F-box domain-containing protein n=1 Tax=Linnemannia elongata AG-77 TaxID=1314771 RepID=A0A197K962_9FUNG|nr:hypothetical protein K457DRAFT_14624 [Linnemannia elongata AG-77]
MTTRQEPEGDGKASRSYSLASAPLRLLSHSFHSTAITHASSSSSSASSSSTITSTAAQQQQLHCTEQQYPTSSLDPYYYQHDDSSTFTIHESTPAKASIDTKDVEPSLSLSSSSSSSSSTSSSFPSTEAAAAAAAVSPRVIPLWSDSRHQQQQSQQQLTQEDQSDISVQWNAQNTAIHIHSPSSVFPSSLDPSSCVDSSALLLSSSSSLSRKAIKLEPTLPSSPSTSTSSLPLASLSTSKSTVVSVVPATVAASSPSLGVRTDGRDRLERLLMPYDIRYSIFGRLSLQDIYNCQLACRLLYSATSDQFIWKRLALNVIQGEFYFDIPKTLPPNIPNWKFFCKRHLLRQKNWRRGHVQDVISLDDNYQKLTTLQIMAPYVLTGCDDGRVHLWNINTRTLLHRFQIRGEITWVEHLQEQKIVAGLGYDIDKLQSEIRLFSTETGQQIGFYEEDFWDLAICAINDTYLVASDGEGRYTTWNWKTGAKVSQFKVEDETSITEALYFVQNTILELHYDGLIRLFSLHGECYGRFTLDSILPNHQVSFCWLHNDFSMVVWESSNTMAHIRLPLLQTKSSSGIKNTVNLERHISQEEWDNQGAEVYWRHQLTHTCNFAAMGGGRFQLLYVQIFENLNDHVPIRVHSLRHSRPAAEIGVSPAPPSPRPIGATTTTASALPMDDGGEAAIWMDENGVREEYGMQHGEYVTAHSLNPELEKIIQGLRPSRIDCDPEYIVVGLVQGGVRLLQFAPVDDDLLERADASMKEMRVC